jgi:hypothetical protein
VNIIIRALLQVHAKEQPEEVFVIIKFIGWKKASNCQAGYNRQTSLGQAEHHTIPN